MPSIYTRTEKYFNSTYSRSDSGYFSKSSSTVVTESRISQSAESPRKCPLGRSCVGRERLRCMDTNAARGVGEGNRSTNRRSLSLNPTNQRTFSTSPSNIDGGKALTTVKQRCHSACQVHHDRVASSHLAQHSKQLFDYVLQNPVDPEVAKQIRLRSKSAFDLKPGAPSSSDRHEEVTTKTTTTAENEVPESSQPPPPPLGHVRAAFPSSPPPPPPPLPPERTNRRPNRRRLPPPAGATGPTAFGSPLFNSRAKLLNAIRLTSKGNIRADVDILENRSKFPELSCHVNATYACDFGHLENIEGWRQQANDIIFFPHKMSDDSESKNNQHNDNHKKRRRGDATDSGFETAEPTVAEEASTASSTAPSSSSNPPRIQAFTRRVDLDRSAFHNMYLAALEQRLQEDELSDVEEKDGDDAQEEQDDEAKEEGKGGKKKGLPSGKKPGTASSNKGAPGAAKTQSKPKGKGKGGKRESIKEEEKDAERRHPVDAVTVSSVTSEEMKLFRATQSLRWIQSGDMSLLQIPDIIVNGTMGGGSGKKVEAAAAAAAAKAGEAKENDCEEKGGEADPEGKKEKDAKKGKGDKNDKAGAAAAGGAAGAAGAAKTKNKKDKKNVETATQSGAKDDGEEEGENEEKEEKEKVGRSQFGTSMILTLEHLRRKQIMLPDFMCPSSVDKSKKVAIRDWLDSCSFTTASKTLPLL